MSHFPSLHSKNRDETTLNGEWRWEMGRRRGGIACMCPTCHPSLAREGHTLPPHTSLPCTYTHIQEEETDIPSCGKRLYGSLLLNFHLFLWPGTAFSSSSRVAWHAAGASFDILPCQEKGCTLRHFAACVGKGKCVSHPLNIFIILKSLPLSLPSWHLPLGGQERFWQGGLITHACARMLHASLERLQTLAFCCYGRHFGVAFS